MNVCVCECVCVCVCVVLRHSLVEEAEPFLMNLWGSVLDYWNVSGPGKVLLMCCQCVANVFLMNLCGSVLDTGTESGPSNVLLTCC